MTHETVEEWMRRTGKTPEKCPTPAYEQSKNTRYRRKDVPKPVTAYDEQPKRTSAERGAHHANQS